MSTSTRNEQRSPSLWAIILILIGVIWLLAQANIITGENLSVLFRLWPVLLIGVGLELLVGRQSRALSTLIVLGTIAILVVLMIVGPSLGLASNVEVTREQFTQPLDGTESAHITVGAGIGELNVRALNDSSNLFDADIRYLGNVQYHAEGSNGNVTVTLENNTDGLNWFSFVDLFNWFDDDNDVRWDVGISPDVPVDLSLSTGTGGADLDLSLLQLTGLNINSGTGGITLTLPAVEGERYDASVSLGTGGATINLEDGIATSLRVNSGTGGVTLDVPDDAPVRLDAQTGTGGIDAPSFFDRISGGDDDNFIGDSGVWETSSYREADPDARIDIHFDGGTGGLTVR
jgi:hypothetical protein